MTAQTVSKWERGNSIPDVQMLPEIAVFFGVTIDQLFAMSIAHICEIRGDRASAVAAYREQLRLMREDWGIVSGAECEEIERAIQKLQSSASTF